MVAVLVLFQIQVNLQHMYNFCQQIDRQLQVQAQNCFLNQQQQMHTNTNQNSHSYIFTLRPPQQYSHLPLKPSIAQSSQLSTNPSLAHNSPLLPISNLPDMHLLPTQTNSRPKIASSGCSSALAFFPISSESRFKPHFLNNSHTTTHRAALQQNDPLLRNSCVNVLRKSDKNDYKHKTSIFNPMRKEQPISELKKLDQSGIMNPRLPSKCFGVSSDNNLFKGSNCRDQHLKVQLNSSRLPVKMVSSKVEESVYETAKTQYERPACSNKNSAISKGSTEPEERKTFKTLNEIVENKKRQKKAQQISSRVSKKSALLNGFEIGRVLGTGKFGEVFLARHRQVGFIVAIKKIVKSKVQQFKMMGQLGREIQLHSSLDHPNIVHFYGCFEEQDNLYLVLEYMNGGTLFDELNQISCLSVRQTVDYVSDVIHAISYMHEKSIAHRDIKPENIVVSTEGVAKLCDFGWSAVVQTSRRTYCGTFDYAPPEILQRKNYYISVDIWCIGVLTFELLTGRVPFEGEHRSQIMQKIVNVDKHRIQFPEHVPAEAREFIVALMQKDPNSRPKSEDLLSFKLFSAYPPRQGRGRRS